MPDIDTSINYASTALPETVEVAEPSQLITLKPELYVAEVFNPFRDSLKKAIKDAGRVKYDIMTKEGMTTAKEQRAIFKAIRTGAENVRKARKAPILEIGKLLDTRYKELEELITPHEDKFDVEITAEVKRIADEKQRKIDEERARVEALENKVQLLKNVPMTLLHADSATLAKAIEQHSLLVLDPKDYEEYLEDGINAVNATLVELEKLRKMAVTREEELRLAELKRQEEARQREAERAELARLQAESEQRQKALDEEERQRAAATAAQAARIAELEAQLAAASKPAEPVIEVAPVEAAPMPETLPEPAPEPVKVKTSGYGGGAPLRPSAQAIIDAVARHFNVFSITAAMWLRTTDFSTSNQPEETHANQ